MTLGARFGRYELLERVGAGGMGEVYRARDHDLSRVVAVKVLPERFATDATHLARFAQEARTASSLNHPNIVTIHEIGQVDGSPFIVMEFVDGETLRQTLRMARALPVKQVLDIAIQVADGLAKAHAAGIVHRDLKPENVMITRDGFAKILDFGLAKMLEAELLGSPSGGQVAETITNLSPNTAPGILLGTAGYMAPEQARGLPADYRSDQFALGAMLYEMATGHRAFHRDTVVQTLSSVIDTEPRPIAELNPSCPLPVRWVIERCLAKDPADRYASTLDLARELRGAREHAGDTPTPGPGPVPTGGRRRPPRWAQVALAAVVVAGALFVMPAVRDWLPWPAGVGLRGEVRLAVLMDAAALPPQDRERTASLVDYVVIRLAELNRFRQSFSVVPTSDVRDAMVHSAGEARRRVAANYVINLSLQRTGEAIVVTASLEDTARLRVVGGRQRRFPLDQFSVEGVADLVSEVLEIELPPADRESWVAAASGVAEAQALFASGLGQTPYQTAQTALEKYDQVQSLQTAVDFFNRAIALDPRYADAYAKLGEAYLRLYRLTLRREDMALAEQNATKARDLDDARPSTWVTLGMIHGQKGEYAAAVQDFDHAIVRSPRMSQPYRELARVEQRAGQPARAEANYRKAIELNADDWSNYSYLGSFLAAANRLAEAEQAFKTATEKAPDNARAWSNLGALYYMEHKFDAAEQALNRAVATYDYGPALSNLGTLEFRVRRQYAEAAQLLERAAHVAPRDYRIWRNLGAAYYWTPGERDRAASPLRRAVEVLDEARRIEPDNPELLAALADVHAMLHDGGNPRPLVGRALALAPADGGIAAVAASVYEMLGDRTAALRQVSVALGAGTDPFEFESDPTFAGLVKDERYSRVANAR